MTKENITQMMIKRLDKIDEKLDRIEIQTTKTNGRVGYLESQSIKDKKHLDIIDNRLGNLEKAIAVDSALHNKTGRLVDLLAKFGPWILVVVLYLLQLGLLNGLI